MRRHKMDVTVKFWLGEVGPLMGGLQCCMSNIRNGHVACPLAIHIPYCL